MIRLTFKITYSHEARAQVALETYRRDVASIKAIIDNALRLRAKLIFDSSAFQSVGLETSIVSTSAVGRVISIVVHTNQETFVDGYESALNGTTLFFFDGVSSIVMNAFMRDEFLLGDFITSVYIETSGEKKITTPLQQVIDPVVEPIGGYIGDVWDKVKTPLLVIVIAASLAITAYFVFKIFELQTKKL